MKSLITCSLAIFLALIFALPASADDQGKVKKETGKMTAMATDGTGRRTVNLSMAEMFNVKRPDLVMERRKTGMNYGSLFVAHELVANGAKMDEIAAQLASGKDIFQVGDDLHANWKQVANDAKKLNGKIDDNLYKHFLDPKADDAKDAADNYALSLDGVKADSDVKQDEISQAQDRYVMWRDRADAATKRGGKLNTADQNAAYRDNVRSAGPQSQGGGAGGAPPAAGGPR